MTETARDKVRNYQFRKVGYIGPQAAVANSRSRRPPDSLAFIVENDPDVQTLYQSSDPALYVWLSEGQEHPWYVGKADMGLKTRWGQWTKGFDGTVAQRDRFAREAKSTTGMGMAARIRRQPAGTVELWARPAGTITLFGQPHTLVSAEEEILIKLLKPQWNNGKGKVQPE